VVGLGGGGVLGVNVGSIGPGGLGGDPTLPVVTAPLGHGLIVGTQLPLQLFVVYTQFALKS
jgi:hypothetical protein